MYLSVKNVVPLADYKLLITKVRLQPAHNG